MLDLVERGEVDLALCVTDAVIAGVSKGRNVNLCGVFVDSPLRWATIAAPSSSIRDITDLSLQTNRELCSFGISRYGSGSHTMAYYLALQLNIPASALRFVTSNNFSGLREGLKLP
jgi:hypothetical protein